MSPGRSVSPLEEGEVMVVVEVELLVLVEVMEVDLLEDTVEALCPVEVAMEAVALLVVGVGVLAALLTIGKTTLRTMIMLWRRGR